MDILGSSKNLGYIPPPPPLPEYHAEDEAPKWSWNRLFLDLPVDKGPKPWTPVGTQPKSSQDPDWRGVIRDNVIVYPEIEPYKFGYKTSKNYFYFDTPDYADPFKKLGYAFKFFTYTGFLGACCRGMMEDFKFTFKNNLFLVRKVMVPWVLSGMAASATAVALANIRGKKDDYWNYGVAGFLFGITMGRKDHLTVFRWVLGSIPAALILKYNAEINGQLVPQINLSRMQFWMLGNNTADNGIMSGDLRFGVRRSHGDPGRDVR